MIRLLALLVGMAVLLVIILVREVVRLATGALVLWQWARAIRDVGPIRSERRGRRLVWRVE